MRGLILLFVVATISISACVSTNVSGYVDPDFDGVGYSKIAVLADTPDYEWRNDIEERVSKRIRKKSASDAVRYMDVVPPTRELSVEEAEARLLEAGVDAVLLVAVDSTEVSQKISMYFYGGSGGGRSSDRRSAVIQFDLLDINRQQRMWTGSAKGSGSGSSVDWNEIRDEVGDDLVKDLKKLGFLIAK